MSSAEQHQEQPLQDIVIPRPNLFLVTPETPLPPGQRVAEFLSQLDGKERATGAHHLATEILQDSGNTLTSKSRLALHFLRLFSAHSLANNLTRSAAKSKRLYKLAQARGDLSVELIRYIEQTPDLSVEDRMIEINQLATSASESTSYGLTENRRPQEEVYGNLAVIKPIRYLYERDRWYRIATPREDIDEGFDMVIYDGPKEVKLDIKSTSGPPSKLIFYPHPEKPGVYIAMIPVGLPKNNPFRFTPGEEIAWEHQLEGALQAA